MLNKLTGKQKNRFLLFAGLVMLWSVYAFAIRNTIVARSQCLILQQQIDSASDAPARAAQLRQELQELETITGNADTSNSLHERLLGVVTTYCQENNLTLRDFGTPVTYRQQEWRVETHPLVVEGSYIALLKLVQQLEKAQTGKIVSVGFHSKRDNKTQVLSLTVTIYVQNIIREKT